MFIVMDEVGHCTYKVVEEYIDWIEFLHQGGDLTLIPRCANTLISLGNHSQELRCGPDCIACKWSFDLKDRTAY